MLLDSKLFNIKYIYLNNLNTLITIVIDKW